MSRTARHECLPHIAVPVHTLTWASVIVPIKDELDNLVPLTQQLIKVLDSCGESRSALFEILFIDDGSIDGSSDLLDRLAADDPRVRVFHFDRNYGQSSAFHAGFKHAVALWLSRSTAISRTIRLISPRCFRM